ncbi:cupin domain-containing protein [Massilia orientalis]|uniref:Cupin domain-containing protein n=1 Tax=Massilia orientalis TaxID=3050128 RepID=A0ACC7MEX4_9BURK|nr:cupin domain-containing protein [Massilia sp. YIM B02787]
MVRRIVTGERNGKSVVVFDGQVENTHDYASVPGFRTTLAWASEAGITLPFDGRDPVAGIQSMLPAPQGTRVIVVQCPPDSVMAAPGFDGAAAGAEYAKYLPGLAETFDTDGSGFHRTATVDYDVILSGELWLELDDGEVRHLKAGDVVIQNGTRHAWRNRTETPAVMLSVLIGAAI